MVKTIGVLILCTLLLAIAMSAAGTVSPKNSLCVMESVTDPFTSERGGGPDGFGYTWNDHPYNWFDIRGLPHTIEVEGLRDDNVIGFFDISGMSPAFKYFWYEVDEFCVGSNGYISFSDKYLMAHPFQRPPSTRRPDDVLFAFVEDLTFVYDQGDTGHVYYNWEDFGDTCIVQFQDVPFWGNVPGGCEGRNTFEIILVAQPDTQGLIIYQWEHLEGDGSGTRYIGWEDVHGEIGYEVPLETAAEGEAIIIENTDPENPVITDLAVLKAITEDGKGFFIYQGGTVEIWATVKNIGNQDVSDASAQCVIKHEPEGTVVYDETKVFGDFIPGQVKTLGWDTSYECIDGTGTYSMTVDHLLDDPYPDNDEVVVELHVIELPTDLSYIGEDLGYRACGTWGWGARFCVPDSIPGDSLLVDEVSVYLYLGYPSFDIWIALMDDNGLEGSPGDTLADTSITVPEGTPFPNWFTLQIDPPAAFREGDCFCTAYIQYDSYNPLFGWDDRSPYSYQGYRYVGYWRPHEVDDGEPAFKVHALSTELYPVTVTLTPDATTVEQGGQLGYTVEVTNSTDENQTLGYWSDVYLWTGEPYAKNPVYGPIFGTLKPGQSKSAHISHRVPNGAPLKTYTLCGRIGFHPDGVWDEDCFEFTVVEGVTGGEGDGG
jgi:hypothetical protein